MVTGARNGNHELKMYKQKYFKRKNINTYKPVSHMHIAYCVRKFTYLCTYILNCICVCILFMHLYFYGAAYVQDAAAQNEYKKPAPA